jgi:septum formation inhibitor MinC
MISIRGRGRSLEIALDRPLAETSAALREQLVERAAFFRGSRATANLGPHDATPAELRSFRDVLAEYGVTLDGVAGPETLAAALAGLELAYLGAAPVTEVAVLPRPRPPRSVELSEGARSLIADFAGARKDLAQRRVTPGPVGIASAGVSIPPSPMVAPSGISTLYHRGTLRGGQALHNMGNIVVIGDVNPGAELIASGDIVVFGALRGVAHAGAQGDAQARVIALELAPTQLRIATLIAVEGEARAARGPEHATIASDRIVITPHASVEFTRREVTA